MAIEPLGPNVSNVSSGSIEGPMTVFDVALASHMVRRTARGVEVLLSLLETTSVGKCGLVGRADFGTFESIWRTGNTAVLSEKVFIAAFPRSPTALKQRLPLTSARLSFLPGKVRPENALQLRCEPAWKGVRRELNLC